MEIGIKEEQVTYYWVGNDRFNSLEEAQQYQKRINNELPFYGIKHDLVPGKSIRYIAIRDKVWRILYLDEEMCVDYKYNDDGTSEEGIFNTLHFLAIDKDNNVIPEEDIWLSYADQYKGVVTDWKDLHQF